MLSEKIIRWVTTKIPESITLPINKGINGNVHVIIQNGQKIAILKQYSCTRQDNVSRYTSELTALNYLNNWKVKHIPSVLHQNNELQCLILSHISGIQKTSTEISTIEIDQYLEFVKKFSEISQKDSFYPYKASEATFTTYDIICSIERRRKILRTPETPFEHHVSKWIEKNIDVFMQKRTTQNIELPSLRILSPSDFGTHNSIWTHTNDLHIIDFEYFGWDNPVKLLCDFLLHPQNQWKNSNNNYFLGKFLELYDDSNLKECVYECFPLFAIKWIYILLNCFSTVSYNKDEEFQKTQFTKAEHWLNIAQNGIEKLL